jgi:hypothetical protein
LEQGKQMICRDHSVVEKETIKSAKKKEKEIKISKENSM